MFVSPKFVTRNYSHNKIKDNRFKKVQSGFYLRRKLQKVPSRRVPTPPKGVFFLTTMFAFSHVS